MPKTIGANTLNALDLVTFLIPLAIALGALVIDLNIQPSLKASGNPVIGL